MSTLHSVGCQLQPLTTAPDHPASAPDDPEPRRLAVTHSPPRTPTGRRSAQEGASSRGRRHGVRTSAACMPNTGTVKGKCKISASASVETATSH